VALAFVFIFVKAAISADGRSRWVKRITGPNGKWFFGLLFIGWAVVGLVATSLNQAWAARRAPPASRPVPGRAWLCPGLYFLVLAFNLAVTFAIGEWWLGLCGLALALTVFGALAAALWAHRRATPVWGEGIQA
jgi:putative membrane protein